VDVGDKVEIIGRLLHPSVMEYDGSAAVVLNVFSDSKGTKCATVKVVSQSKARSGKRYFPCSALKKV
jgi:hypothetical protein